MKKKTVLFFLVCIFFFSSFTLAYSESKVFLLLKVIPGESTDKDHIGWIDCLNWSWQVSNPDDSSRGSVIFRPLIVTKYIDKSSPSIFLYVANGSHIAEAIISVVDKTSNIEYVRIKMEDVQLVNISPGGNQGDARVFESVALTFGRVFYRYVRLDDKGIPQETVEHYWDLNLNRGG